ncbi:hypothetical protein HPP92_026290 [Vanilla planifolia]|uniref:Uncharacterized protein n=1 Tax=Vanilla planifolia TaxID=51239 RepID=A0A835U9N9_VANPL|nr:hypothetical protein HPP92_026290 [Vanilla planifolia]
MQKHANTISPLFFPGRDQSHRINYGHTSKKNEYLNKDSSTHIDGAPAESIMLSNSKSRQCPSSLALGGNKKGCLERSPEKARKQAAKQISKLENSKGTFGSPGEVGMPNPKQQYGPA